MKSKLIILGLIVVLMLSLLACESALTTTEEEQAGKTAAEAGDSYVAATSMKYYTCSRLEKSINIEDEVSFPVNKGVTVVLCSNPSTGYQWNEQADIADSSVVEQTGHQYVAPADDKVGAAGTEKFIFSGAKTGKTTVYLEYTKQGESEPLWTCTLTISVR
jgi:predicted secreted protein